MLKWLWLSAVVIVLDQITKSLASSHLLMHVPEPLVPFLNLTLMHNTGAAFSLLADAGGWQRWFFALIALVISSVIIVWLYRLPPGKAWLAAGLALLVGGAIGNLWDRILLGYVIDFIDVYYRQWHWPAFNVADSAIVLGAVILVFDALFGKEEQSND